MTDSPPKGRYRHFKGNEYELLFVATHSETLEPMVVYRALYGERGVWVRPCGDVGRDGRARRQDVQKVHLYRTHVRIKSRLFREAETRKTLL